MLQKIRTSERHFLTYHVGILRSLCTHALVPCMETVTLKWSTWDEEVSQIIHRNKFSVTCCFFIFFPLFRRELLRQQGGSLHLLHFQPEKSFFFQVIIKVKEGIPHIRPLTMVIPLISYFQTWYPVFPRIYVICAMVDSWSDLLETTGDGKAGTSLYMFWFPFIEEMFSALSAVFLFGRAFVCFVLVWLFIRVNSYNSLYVNEAHNILITSFCKHEIVFALECIGLIKIWARVTLCGWLSDTCGWGPSTLIRFQTKTELFCSVFKTICVHT